MIFLDEELNKSIPWLPYGMSGILGYILQPHMRVFEWGSGGSTLFWAERVSEVVSIEHDPRSFEYTSEMVRDAQALAYLPPETKIDLRLVEPREGVVAEDHADPAAYFSESYSKNNFRAYAAVIEQWPEDRFDLVVIDGRARPSCLFHGYNRVARGGFLLLDNSSRYHYLKNTGHLVEDWPFWKVHGRGPYNDYSWEATLWQRPRQWNVPVVALEGLTMYMPVMEERCLT